MNDDPTDYIWPVTPHYITPPDNKRGITASDYEKTTLWVGSTRYYLGRMTYAVADFTEALYRHWHSLPEPAQSLIIRDVEEAFAKDDADREAHRDHKALGMECDRARWEKVRRLWGA
jgi:hypothetical protein